MYSLIDYSSNYSETAGSLWFYSKDKATNFNAGIANNNNFQSFEYAATLLRNAVTQPNPNHANGILKKKTIAVPLKYFSNFWRSVEIPLINCKVELKIKWTKYCLLSAAGNDNVNNNDSDNIFFPIKGTKLYVPAVTLSAKDKQKVSKLPSKGFERSVYWNEYKIKSESKKTTNEYRDFLESSFVGVNRLFVLVYINQDANAKRFNARKFYLKKGISKNYNIVIDGKNFYDQPIDSDIKRYEEIRKLTTVQGEDYTKEYLLDYDYIKNHYR